MNFINKYSGVLAGVALIVAIFVLVRPIPVKVIQSSIEKNLGQILDTSYFDYFDATTGYKLDGTSFWSSSLVTITPTTTVAVSYDGFVVSKTLTVATGTVQTVFTNTYGPMVCYGGNGSLYAKTNNSFSPSLQFTVGTSTSATLNSANLLASTTVATTTTTLVPLLSYWTILGSGQSIVAEIGDITNTEASSTYFGNWSVQVNVNCHLIQ